MVQFQDGSLISVVVPMAGTIIDAVHPYEPTFTLEAQPGLSASLIRLRSVIRVHVGSTAYLCHRPVLRESVARVEVIALGVGTPTPTATSWGSSFIVTAGNDRILFDCGPAATRKMVEFGTFPTDVSHLFLTHLHFDHVVDVPALLLSRWDQGAGNIPPLEVFGPTPTARFITDIIGPDGLFRDDIAARIEHPGSQAVFQNRGGTLPRPRPRTNETEIEPDSVVQGVDWTVRAGHAQHAQPFLDSLAYRIDSDKGSVVFTGDTEPCVEVIALAERADVLFSMAWDLDDRMVETGESTGQTGPLAAAKMAQQASVKKLVLVHHGPKLADLAIREQVLRQVEDVFDGDALFADEGTIVTA